MQGSNIQPVKELLSTEAIKHHLMHVLGMSYFGCPPSLAGIFIINVIDQDN